MEQGHLLDFKNQGSFSENDKEQKSSTSTQASSDISPTLPIAITPST
jgi:hypothetical protein